ncbi:ATP synthase subunit I [Roseateles flavus]|uniref:ATP synthase subunit I n=1 Tax=Roseateles flavus TaxID=3149041 RepID=A0ABV0G8J8_9BURK
MSSEPHAAASADDAQATHAAALPAAAASLQPAHQVPGTPTGVRPDPWNEDGEEDFKAREPLTPEEAAAWRARHRATSPWRVVLFQGVAAVLMVALWTLFGSTRHGLSALFGALAVVGPNALMAWGTTRRPAGMAGAALLSLMVWELIKILLVAVILLAVIKGVPDLRWPALLLTMVVCLKVYWLVLLRWGRNKN